MAEHFTPDMVALGEALLDRDDLAFRLLVQAWLRIGPEFATVPHPQTDNTRVLVAAATVVELLATQEHQTPPAWAVASGALPEPFFALEWANGLASPATCVCASRPNRFGDTPFLRR